MSITTTNVTTVVTPVYTSIGNSAITFLSLCNYSASNVTANLYVVPNGDSASSQNLVISNLLIPADDTYQFYVGNEKLLLSNGDTVQVNAAINSAISTVTSYTIVN